MTPGQALAGTLGAQSMHPILRLQRSIGNRALGQLLSPPPLVEAAEPDREQSDGPAVQRQCQSCTAAGDEEEQPVQRKVTDPVLASVLRTRSVQAKSSSSLLDGPSSAGVIPSESHGKPLETRARDMMESRLDADFSRVRIHTDAPAARAADSINAIAFTTGRDIYFGDGNYDANHAEGRHLLAHELTHTIQQSKGQTPTMLSRKVDGVVVGHPDDPLEREADAAADRAVPAPSDSKSTPTETPDVGGGESQPAKFEEAEKKAEPATEKQAPKPVDQAKADHKAEEKVAPAPQDALKPGDEGEPKKPGLDAQKPAKPEGKKQGASAQAVPEEARPKKPQVALAAAVPGGAEVTPEANLQAVPDTPEQAAGASAKTQPTPLPPPPEQEPAPLPAAGQAAEAPAEPAEPEAAEPAAEISENSEQTLENTEAAPPPPPAEAAQAETPKGSPPEVPGLEATPEPGAAAEGAPEAASESSTESASAPQAEAAPAPAPASESAAPTTAPETTSGSPSAHEAPTPAASATASAPAAPATETALPEVEVQQIESEATVAENAQGPAPESQSTEPETAPPPGSEIAPTAAAEASTPGQQGAPQQGGCDESPGDAAAPGGTEAAGAAGPCGGGGGGEVPDKPPPAAPDVSGADPTAAMGAMADLPPAQLQTALGGVTSAASKAVGQEKQKLAANPPQLERPSGVPAQRDPSVPVVPRGVPLPNDPKAVNRVPAGQSIPVKRPDPLPAPGPVPVQSAPTPKLPAEGELTDADSAKVTAAVDDLPTTDPALKVTAGAPPQLELAGDADPKRSDEQRAKLNESTGQAQTQGNQDVAAPMGENDIYPTVPKETLKADVRGEEGGPGVAGTLAACAKGGSAGLAAAKGKGQNGAGGEGGAGADQETLSIVAQEKKGDEIKASVAKAQADMNASRENKDQKVVAEKDKSQKEIDQLIENNSAQQKNERTNAREESLKLRTDWHKEQGGLTDAADKDATKATTDARTKVAVQEKSANSEATGQIEAGNKEANQARVDAENKAAVEKEKGKKKDSGGFFGWLSSKVKAFFDSIKSAIKGVFDAARKLVKAAIEKAKQLATAIIEKARQAVVAAIRAAGDVLIAIGDRVLAGFPALRDRFRKAVKERVNKAVETVNKLADALKKGVLKALDLLGAAIDAALGLLECAYMAAVDAVASVVEGAINLAKNLVQLFAVFAQLIKDIASDPGQWISNLGTAVVDGLKYCFWDAFKTAVKNWFNSKVEEVLGLPMQIFKLLFKGCIKMADIGKMAWEGLKAAIPMVLVQLLIEKLVAMIVPAAGAILTIIEGLRAAWGTVSRIIAAFTLFFAFLKAVKPGKASGKFATALAAAGVVVIDFVANWLLMRLRKPAGAIAGRLKALAQKIVAGLKKVFGVVKKGAKAAVGAVKRGIQAVGRGIKNVGRFVAKSKIGKAILRTMRRVGRAIAQSKVGRTVKNAIVKVKAGIAKVKQKAKQWWENRRKRTPEQMEAAKSKISSRLASLFERGVSRLRLILQLAIWRAWYGFHVLKLQGDHANPEAYAEASPGVILGRGQEFDRQQVLRVLYAIEGDLTKRLIGTTSTKGSALVLRPGEDPARLGAILAGRKRIPDYGAALPIRVFGEPISAAQATGATNVVIRSLGRYPDITKRLANEGFETGPELARTVTKTIKTGNGPKVIKDLIALQAVESGRIPLTNVTRPLATFALRQGLVTPAELFGTPGDERSRKFGKVEVGGGGIAPETQIGAVRAARRAKARGVEGEEFREGTQIHERSEEHLDRVFELVATVTQEMVFNDERHMARKAEQLVEVYIKSIGRR